MTDSRWQSSEDLSHLQPVAPAPPPQATTGFLENLASGFEEHQHVDAAFSLQYDLYDAIEENNKRLTNRFGAMADTAGPSDPAIGVFNADELSIIASHYTDSDLAPFYTSQSGRDAAMKKFEAYNARLMELKKTYPDVQTFDEMFAKVRATRGQYAEDNATTYGAANFGGTVGNFVGSMAGSFDFYRDPLVFGSLFAGGFGKNIATRIATEAGAVGGAQLAQDYLFVQPMREALNEPDVNYLQDFAGAALLGGVFRGLHEAAPIGFRALQDRVQPGRKFANALEHDVGAWDGTRFDGMPDTPSVRAGRAILDHDAALREANPYGDTDEGVAKFVRELDETDRAFSEDNFTPEEPPREPTDIRSMAEARDRLQVEAPETFARLTQAENKLDELTNHAQGLENFIDNRTLGDVAATLVDEKTGARIKELEKMLDDPALPEMEKRSAELEADKIINQIGPERIMKAGEDAAIKPRYELQDTRNSIKAARREFNGAAREAFDQLDRIAAREAAKQTAEHAIAVKSAKEILPNPAPAPPHILSDETARTTVAATDEAVKAAPDQTEAIIKTGKQLLSEDKPEAFDLQNGDKVSLDFRLELEDGSSATVREILSDLGDDDAMLEAMRTCAI